MIISKLHCSQFFFAEIRPFVFSLVAPLVLPEDSDKVTTACNYGKTDEGDTNLVSSRVGGCLLRQEGECRDDTANISKTNLETGSYSPPGVRAQVACKPTNDNWHCTVSTSGTQEQCGVLGMNFLWAVDFE